MKLLKKSIAFILAIILAMSMLTCLSFASEKTEYLVLGDSIGWGAGLLNPEEACAGKIVADTNGYAYKNDAISGFQSHQLFTYIHTDEITSDIIKADIISISIGGNDFLQDHLVPLLFNAVVKKDYSLFHDAANKFYDNLCGIVSYIKEINPDVTIILQTICNPRYDFLRDIFQYGANLVNECFFRYVDENPDTVYIVDVEKALFGRKDCVAIDTVHPNAKGNIEIARLILAKLNELGLGSNTEPIILNDGIDMKPQLNNISKYMKYLIQKLIFDTKTRHFRRTIK